MKNILIIDDDLDTLLKYKKWLEDQGYNLNMINNPEVAEQNFKPGQYDLVLVGYMMSVMDGFDLYNKLLDISKSVGNAQGKHFKICFMTASRINYKALAEIHPELGEECYVCKKVEKKMFINHINSLI
jgi:CheY-like chemotaxis protein